MPSDFSRVVEQSVLQASNVIANQGGTGTDAIHQVTVPAGKRYTVLFYECVREQEGDIIVSWVDSVGTEIIVDKVYSGTELRGPLHIPYSYPAGTIVRVSYGTGVSGLMVTKAIVNVSDEVV